MSEKIYEALSNLLQGENTKEISKAIEEMLENSKNELELDYQAKLQEAYEEATEKIAANEAIAEEGYKEAYGMIQELRNRLELQHAEFNEFMEGQYEEAFKVIEEERSKADALEVQLYDQFNNELKEMKSYLVDKIHEFLSIEGKEIYEQARKDLMNNPQLAEEKVTLSKIVETVLDHISDEDYSASSNKKLEETKKSIDELKGQLKIFEARNIRLSTENTKLTESVRERDKLIKEQTEKKVVVEEKERVKVAEKVQGRGTIVTEDRIIAEHDNAKVTKPVSESVQEDSDAERKKKQYQFLAGIRDDI